MSYPCGRFWGSALAKETPAGLTLELGPRRLPGGVQWSTGESVEAVVKTPSYLQGRRFSPKRGAKTFKLW
jgi:hypothetical protein